MTTQHILVIDHDLHAIAALTPILEDIGRVSTATSGVDALASIAQQVPDVVLLAASMPGMTGFEICRTLKADARCAAVPVILLTRCDDRAGQQAILDCGAADFVEQPADPLLVRTRVRTQLRIKALVDALASSARTDALTGLANRREFEDVLEREWHRGERGGDALSVLMIDVDHFRAYNDHEGTPAGDRCLTAIAATLRAIAMRRGDLVARHAGGAFVLVLPQTPRQGADFLAGQILAAIDDLAIAHVGAPDGKLTVSIGLSSYDQQSPLWVAPRANADFARHQARRRIATDLVRAAERALTAAKRAGRARARALDVAHLDDPEKARTPSPPLLRRTIAGHHDRRETSTVSLA